MTPFIEKLEFLFYQIKFLEFNFFSASIIPSLRNHLPKKRKNKKARNPVSLLFIVPFSVFRGTVFFWITLDFLLLSCQMWLGRGSSAKSQMLRLLWSTNWRHVLLHWARGASPSPSQQHFASGQANRHNGCRVPRVHELPVLHIQWLRKRHI